MSAATLCLSGYDDNNYSDFFKSKVEYPVARRHLCDSTKQLPTDAVSMGAGINDKFLPPRHDTFALAFARVMP